MVTSELLRCLGHEGFLQLINYQAQMYQQKRDMAIQAAAKHLSGEFLNVQSIDLGFFPASRYIHIDIHVFTLIV